MDNQKKKDEGELRRWVANLQLESWQLELLITGFSIFLLATSLQEFDAFEASYRFNKLSGQGHNVIFAISLRMIIAVIPIALKFFLISLLIHLLLRGFWIGIVGLSSVSNKIDFDQINLQKPFNKFIPANVRTLDELILFVDKVSSVIFAYTYLIAFSLLSVVLVGAFLVSVVGLTLIVSAYMSGPVAIIVNLIIGFVWLVLALGALLFFLDTLLFSFMKRSKIFAVLFYPIYRFYSIISISFLYRSIYYHLLTNFKRKQIALVSLALFGTFLVVNSISNSDQHTFYPEVKEELSTIVLNRHYDDQRGDEYIRSASIPSKFADGRYLELFIRYNPNINSVLRMLCPDAEGLELDESFMNSFNAGMESATDSTLDIRKLIYPIDQYKQNVQSSLSCIAKAYEVYINGLPVSNLDFEYTRHQNKNEKGFLLVLDIDSLQAGRHIVEIKNLERQNPNVFVSARLDDFEMESLASIQFWKN